MNNFPFLDKSPIIKEYHNIKCNKLSLVPYNYTLSNQNLIYYVQPLGVFVPYLLKKDYQETFYANIVEVDYSQVADLIEVSNNIAFYPVSGYYESCEIKDDYFINKASNGVRVCDSVRIKSNILKGEFFMNTPYNEASLDDMLNLSSIPVTINKQTPIQARIDSYLNGGYVTQRCLLLVGPSAVAKSAQVKSICDKYGYRLVDLRSSFMSRLDLQGLTDIVYNEDGSVNSTQSPMQEFVECTDEYIKFCRASVPVIEDKISKETDEDKISKLKVILDRYKEGAKPPVLFFDEISRTEASVRQALTNILTSKTFMGYKMSIARIIAADNHPIDSSDDLKDIFLTNTTEDSAFNDRFEAVPVTPSDVLPSWIDWAHQSKDGKQNIHQYILDFLEENEDLYYYFSDVENQYLEDFDEYKLSVASYPNYRTWEFVSNYLYETDSPKVTTISGYLGNKTASMLIPYLQSKGIKFDSTPENDWDSIVEDAIVNRTPTLLASPSGIGKTSRVHSIAKKLNAVTLDLNLSELDRVDLMGPPAKVSTISHIGGQVGAIDEDLSKSLQKVSEGFDLPQNITVRAPRLDIVNTFKDAISQGRKVVLMFDEMNRVTNPAVMSAVFEAISDHRIFGVTFDPKQVSIICACNMGANFQDTQRLDPAFAARLNVHTKDSYGEDDVKSIRDFISANYNTFLNDYISKLSDEQVIDLVSQVEQRAIDQSVPSTRALYDLSLYLDDSSTSSLCTGTILFSSSALRRKAGSLSKVKDFSDNNLQVIISEIDGKVGNWAALDTPATVKINNEQVPPRDLVSLYNECKVKLAGGENQYLPALLNIIQSMMVLDVDIQNTREKTIGYIVGNDMAQSFCEYYNTVSGTSIVSIKIADLKDINLYPKYLEQQNQGVVNPKLLKGTFLKSLRDIHAEFGFSLQYSDYRFFILRGLDTLITSDMKLESIKEIVSETLLDSILKYAENGDTTYVEEILKVCGYNITLNPKDFKASKSKPVYKTQFI